MKMARVRDENPEIKTDATVLKHDGAVWKARILGQQI